MKTLKVKIQTKEELLGMASGNHDLHADYIASKAPDAKTMAEEIEELGIEEVEKKSMTIFPRMEDGTPFLYDYQIKGFFKDSCSALRKMTGSVSSKIKAYKKEIDGLIFVGPRRIPIKYEGEMSTCQRPLRASTPMGERIALACSESIPAGATLTFKIVLLCDDHEKAVREWLTYGKFRGLGQWRNSGKGRFEVLSIEVVGEEEEKAS